MTGKRQKEKDYDQIESSSSADSWSLIENFIIIRFGKRDVSKLSIRTGKLGGRFYT